MFDLEKTLKTFSRSQLQQLSTQSLKLIISAMLRASQRRLFSAGRRFLRRSWHQQPNQRHRLKTAKKPNVAVHQFTRSFSSTIASSPPPTTEASTSSSTLPESKRVVIIGGGVIGCSVAYNLGVSCMCADAMHCARPHTCYFLALCFCFCFCF